MRKIKCLLLQITLVLVSTSCKAQQPKVKDLSNNIKVSYILGNIWEKPIIEELWKGGLYIKIFKMSDSKATPEGLFEGYGGILSSLIISVLPDGDYYTNSRLYKIEGLANPKIIEIKETTYPKFSIKIEHGFYDKRKIETFEFEGVK